jgi:ABC-type branched-subunit amino acid transport system substrate-binding protein
VRIRTVSAIVAMLLFATAACSSNSKKAATSTKDQSTAAPSSTQVAASPATTVAQCTGTPVKLFTINTLSTVVAAEKKAVPAGMRAAAEAANKSCEAGVPIQIVACDDKLDPNAGTACGRQAVDEKAAAVVGSSGGFGDLYGPIIAAAGIPEIGTDASGTWQSTNADSFPLFSGTSQYFGHLALLKALGATSVTIAYIDVTGVSSLVGLAKARLQSLGIGVKTTIAIGPTATDYSQFAAQVNNSGADGLSMILGGSQVVQLIKAMVQLGASLDKLHIVTSTASLTPADLAAGGAVFDGVYVVGSTWPVGDSSNAGVAQYLSELKAAGETEPASDEGFAAWAFTHAVAQMLNRAATKDAKGLLAEVEKAKVDMPGIPATDFSQNAVHDDPFLSKLRTFSRQVVISHVVGGKFVRLSGFVDELSVTDMTAALK